MKEIKDLVYHYKDTIGTQNEEEFRSLSSRNEKNTLISITTLCEGTDSIVRDFLIGGIQAAQESIELVVEGIDVRMISEDVAIVLFHYHTECIRRETKEPYSIKGLETQVVVKEDGEWKLAHVHYSK